LTTQDSHPITLASESPRRIAFFRLLGFEFLADAARMDEASTEGVSPAEIVVELSRAKAHAVAARHPDAIVIGADTIVVADGEIMGKPANEADAMNMLRKLRGRSHSVFSGITVIHPERGEVTEWSETIVHMRAYSEAEMRAYVESRDPMDKAGAYAIQNAGFHPVSEIRGCYASVMGLPLCHLARAMQRLGVPLGVDVPDVCRDETGHECPVYPQFWPGLSEGSLPPSH
jgi:septum formation protein